MFLRKTGSKDFANKIDTNYSNDNLMKYISSLIGIICPRII